MALETAAPARTSARDPGAASRTTPLRISIVTPNFNGAAFIEETLKSVVGQNYPNLEFIVVDGASTDASLAIIRRYEAAVSALIVEPDRGHADALNKGFSKATGDILGWINSDDILLPGALSFIDRLFRARPGVDWATGRPASMDEESRINWIGPLRPWSRLRFLAGDNRWIQQESTFWRRSLWDRAGGALDLRYDVANDFDLWRRFFRHADLYTVDRHLGCFRVRAGQRSATFKDRYEEEARAILAEELTGLNPDFGAAYQHLLPASVEHLKSAAEIAGDRRYRICDPPILRAGDALGWSKSNSAAAPPGDPIWRAGAPSDLSPFKDRHKGERCFIMGNGPSLNDTDLSLLAGETVFACNAAFLLFDRIDWRPCYYVCVDARVLPDRAAEIDAMLAADPSITGFFPTFLREEVAGAGRTATRAILPPGRGRYYFTEAPNALDDLPHSMFSYDANESVVQPFTVAITMLQLAAYMGFSEIVLIGCDTSYVVPETVRRDQGGLALTSSRDDDPNHFDPRYFGRGRKWHDPQTDKMIMHYDHAKAALDAIGVAVYNATVGGRLEVFPRRSLESFFVAGTRDPRPRQPPVETRRAEGGRRMGTRIAAMRNGLSDLYGVLTRSPQAAIGAGAVLLVAIILAVLFRDAPAAPYLFMGAGFAALLTLIAIIALRLRGFIVELSRQVLDIAEGAVKPPEGAVIGRIEMEEELFRLREEVERLKSEAAARNGGG